MMVVEVCDRFSRSTSSIVALTILSVWLQLPLFSAVLHARPLPSLENPVGHRASASQPNLTEPVFQTRLQYAGQLWLAVTNYGVLGTEATDRVEFVDKTRLRIGYSPSLEFPAGTRNEYLYAGGLWVGGIVGRDTLVSMAISAESSTAFGEFVSFDSLIERSNVPGTPQYHPDARAEQEYIARFADTGVIGGVDPVDNRRHRPLNIAVTMHTYAWSDPFAKQFVILEYWIKNIGERPIDKMACGLYMDPDILNIENGDPLLGTIDDVSGFLFLGTNPIDENLRDPISAAWFADGNGDPVGGTYSLASPDAVVGARILRTPPVERLSFNWWLSGARNSWGPVRTGARTPSLFGGLGSPQGDRSAYYIMTNGEQDYNQYVTNIDKSAQGWRPPPSNGACDIADGADTRQLLSAGPVCDPLFPGDSLCFTFAIVAGHDFHPPPNQPFACAASDAYVAALNFRDFAFASIWAGWIYDTPGVDTDRNGYAGAFRELEGGRVYYSGDLGPPPGFAPPCATYGGAPDLAGPTGPPCPRPGIDMHVETRPNEIIVRWNGRQSETTPDPLTKTVDFEGYRIYASRFNAPGQFSMIASWDSENYRRYIYRGIRWVLDGGTLSADSLRALYGPDFDPTDYGVPSPALCLRDTLLLPGGGFMARCSYFEPIGANHGNTYFDGGDLMTNTIQKLGDSTVIDGGDTLRFGCYEARLTNLNPAEPLYVSVTAFDAGHPRLRIDPLESLPGTCVDYAIPIYDAGVVEDSALRVSVYPNPYKISYHGADGRRTSYFEEGYEAPGKRATGANFNEQDRRIWFVNLPTEATIRIYTLDGDLVRTLHHQWPRPENESFLTDYSSRTAWDLVSRNTQAVVSGIYIYHIESPLGTQTGKIVIVK